MDTSEQLKDDCRRLIAHSHRLLERSQQFDVSSAALSVRLAELDQRRQAALIEAERVQRQR